jgi:hypothetical protein
VSTSPKVGALEIWWQLFDLIRHIRHLSEFNPRLPCINCMVDDYISSNPHHLLAPESAPAYAGSVHSLVVKVIACGFQYKANAHKGEAFEAIKIVHFSGQKKARK